MTNDPSTSAGTRPAPASRLTRRSFLKVAGSVGGSFIVGFYMPVCQAVPAGGAVFEPNAFVQIQPGGEIVLTMPYVEMGQGTYTSIPMLIAEELEVDLQDVRLEHAPPDETRYVNPLLGVQATGNSNAIRGGWMPLRRAGAAARMMLVAAAAARWGVEPGSCHAERGEVVHGPSGRRLAYGAIAVDAAGRPVPEDVILKGPEQFRLIGTPAKRLDLPGKVNGTAVFGIDARPPGVRIATLLQAPVRGGTLRRLDDTAARAIAGVREVVRLKDAVAVVADHMAAATKGLAALVVEWDDGPNAAVSSETLGADLDAAIRTPGAVAESVGSVDAAAATTVEANYQVPFLAHAAMEPMNCTAHVRQDGCEVWVGSQALARARNAAAKAAGLTPEQVVIHNHLIGGGFGRRLEIDGVTRAVEVARHVDGPVKLIWTREEDIRQDMYWPRGWMRRENRCPGPTASPDPRSSPDGCRQRLRTASIPTPPKVRSTFRTILAMSTSNTSISNPGAFPRLSGAASGPPTMSSSPRASWMSSPRRPNRILWRIA
jgi:isoquinoline 1-oxidoreductase beta subunit